LAEIENPELATQRTRFEKYKINNLSHRRRIQCGDGALYVSYRI
jgi:hypothetical protein